MKKYFFAAALVFIFLLVVVPKVIRRMERERVQHEQQSVAKPPAQARTSVASASSAAQVTAVNWDVPFTSQAPNGDWSPPFDEACEEASVLMVLRYFRGEEISSSTDADAAIRALAQKNADLGFPIDTSAEQVASLLRAEDASLDVRLLQGPTVQNLKDALLDGALIILPAQGQELKNPYFRRPGPPYHMLVVRGFTSDGFAITNDPGTKRGEQYVYAWDVLMEAMHDWNNGAVAQGKKVVIVIKK